MKLAALAFGTPRRYRLAQRTVLPALRLLTKVPGLARIVPGPLAAWTSVRELPEPPRETFGDWWRGRSAEDDPPEQQRGGSGGASPDGLAGRDGGAPWIDSAVNRGWGTGGSIRPMNTG
jgi:hypothetical protein